MIYTTCESALPSSPKKSLLITPFGLMTATQNVTHLHTSSAVLRIVVGPPGGSDGSGGELRGGGAGTGAGLGGGTTSGVGGGDKTFGGTTNTTGGANGGKDGQLCCPKCGNPCTHVETFVCMYYL